MSSYDEQISCIQHFFANLDKAQSGQTYKERIQAIGHFRREVRTSDAAQEALRSCIWADDGAIRISAAESLSLARVYPDESIPVLVTVLDVAREQQEIESYELWTGLAIGALTNYGPLAGHVQHVVWPFLHCEPTTHILQRMATRFVIRLAKTSSASWTLACLLCHHEDDDLRELARSIMKSEEFKTWD